MAARDANKRSGLAMSDAPKTTDQAAAVADAILSRLEDPQRWHRWGEGRQPVCVRCGQQYYAAEERGMCPKAEMARG